MENPDGILVDWFETTYSRGFAAVKNSLKFSHDAGSRYQISGFIEVPVNGLFAYDITSASDVRRVENGTITTHGKNICT